MKHTKLTYAFLAVITTLLSMWVLPSLIKKMTDGAKNYPLVYYSSTVDELCIIDFVHDKDSFSDTKGNRYPRTQYDSIIPMLNFRQLMMDGKLPDTIEGQPIDPKMIRMKQVIFRYYPSLLNAPQPQMGVLLEAMPKRLNLTLPGDYFRMGDEMTFIDAETNKVDVQKSARFTEAMKRKGFTFPVKNYWGNPTTRKAYEEGYFCLDSKGELFHVKMVNGRPFVKNTEISKQMEISWFSMMEVPDKRFYGFVFGKNGETGIIESDGGGYRLVKMQIPPFDITKDDLTVMGNMLYWTVRVTNEEGMNCYALHSDNLEKVSQFHMDEKTTLWDEISPWLFITTLSFENENSAYVSFYFTDLSYKALILNIFIALLFMMLWKKETMYRRRLMALYLIPTGLIGILSLLFLPPYEEN